MPRFYHGVGAIGAQLPALQQGAFDQASLSYAMQEQKLKAAERQMDFENAVTITKIKESQVIRQLEQQRIAQQDRQAAISERNQFAAMGARPIRPDAPVTPDFFRLTGRDGTLYEVERPEVAQRREEAREEFNQYSTQGFVEGVPPPGSVPVTLRDNRTMYKPVTSYDLEKPESIAGYWKESLLRFTDDQERIATTAGKEYDDQIVTLEGMLAKAPENQREKMRAKLEGVRAAKADAVARFPEQERKRMAKAMEWWQARAGKPVNWNEVPPEYMPSYTPPVGTPIEAAVQEAPVVQYPGFKVMRDPAGLRFKTDDGRLSLVVPKERVQAAALVMENLALRDDKMTQSEVQRSIDTLAGGAVPGTGISDAELAIMASDPMLSTLLPKLLDAAHRNRKPGGLDAEDTAAYGVLVATLKREVAKKLLEQPAP